MKWPTMFKKIIIYCLISIIILLSFQCYAGTVPHKGGTVCWPLHFAGITLGITNDSQVKRLLGTGKFYNLGDGVERYFVDKDRHATLHVVMFTDLIVGELTVLEGIDPTLKSQGKEIQESVFFDPTEGFGNWRALHLGSSMKDVLDNLGIPGKKNNDAEWVYSTTCACEIPEYFTIFFRNGRIFKIVFSAPPG